MMVSYHPSLVGRPALRWDESIEIAGGAGFGFTDLDLTEVAEVDPGVLCEKLDAGGLRAGAASLPAEFRAGDHVFEESLAFLRRIAPLAAEIGVQVMHRSLPASSDIPFVELWPQLQRRWSECAAILREHGILAAVEPLGTPYRRCEGEHEFISRLDIAAEFASSCGEGIGVLVDSWHWHLSGASASDVVGIGELIVHVHVADVPALPSEALRDDERVLPGDGIVDFDSFHAAIAMNGYQGLVSPEVPGSWSAGLGAAEAARRGFEATRGMIADTTGTGRPPRAARISGGGGGTCSDSPAVSSQRHAGGDPLAHGRGG